jgi:hypothetical protein
LFRIAENSCAPGQIRAGSSRSLDVGQLPSFGVDEFVALPRAAPA